MNNIPEYPAIPHQANSENILCLSDVKNFLCLLNNSNFPSKEAYLEALQATDYDILIIDLFYNDKDMMNKNEIESLKQKSHGGSRLVLAYMSIGEAEAYRYYWRPEWKTHPPEWLEQENPDWSGNYKVQYWHPKWQKILFGNDASYVKKIIDAGLDGTYLDLIDAYEYFEEQEGLGDHFQALASKPRTRITIESLTIQVETYRTMFTFHSL